MVVKVYFVISIQDTERFALAVYLCASPNDTRQSKNEDKLNESEHALKYCRREIKTMYSMSGITGCQ